MSYNNGYGGMPQGMQGGGNFGGGGGYNNGGGMRSFNGGSPGNRGGGRGRGRRDDRGRGRGGFGGGGDRAHVPETTGVRFRKMVIKLGDEEDFDPIEDPPRLAKVLMRSWKEGCLGVFDGFRIGITQEPFKTAYYVALLLQLSIKSDSPVQVKEEEDQQIGEKRKAEDEGSEDCGKEVLENLSIAFRTWVEGREWLNVRQCLNFFSLLLPAGLVSGHSLLSLYQSMLSVLTELGGGGDRAERVIRAVGEGLLRSGQNLQAQFPEEVDGLIGSIEAAVLGRRGGRALNDPLSPILSEGQEPEPYQDTLGHLLAALHSLRSNDYAPPECLARPWESVEIPEGSSLPEPYDLASVSMPPEMYDVNEDSLNGGEGQIGTIKFFGDDVVPPPDTPLGWTLRSIIIDTVHIFEVNRKECARILLTIRQYLPIDTFKPLATVTATEDPSASTSTISLESLIVSTILSAMFSLPQPPYDLIYYGAVITELCKLSPNTVAPPVGRAVRKLFTLLGTDGLDNEISRRAAEWFAVHLSNFGFQWMWKEWIPDLELPSGHPKRAFIRKVVDSEVRLAYHDRILQTLPEAMQAPEAKVIGEDPQPHWPYERDEHPLHHEAVELLGLLRKKATNTEVQTYLVTLPNVSSGPDEPMPSNVRSMAIETILQLGSRSFSHFLNATERYLDILRSLTPDPASRQLLLASVSSYWKQSQQMQLITIDKYITYGVLEGLDVVDWVFSESEEAGAGADEADGWTDGHKWEILRMCLDKHSGRVAAVKKRLRTVERADEAARARRAADVLEKGGDVGEEDVEIDDAQPERSNEARDAQTSLDIQTTRLEKILLSTSKQFINTLLPSDAGEGLRVVLKLLDAGEEAWWSTRARYGWFREFVRRYQGHLGELKSVVERDVLHGMEGRAEEMVKDVWGSIL